MKPSRILPVLAAFLIAPGASAQYTGTFTVPNQAGGMMTLTLQEGFGGVVTGSLSSNGVQYQIQGRVVDGMVAGSMNGSQGLLFFEGERWENDLRLILYGSTANGQPSYEDYTELAFVEASASAGSSGSGFGGNRQAGGATQNPLAGGGNAGNRSGVGGTDPFIGTFSDGNVTLTLQGGGGQYQGQVHVAGASYPVVAQGGAQGIEGTIQAPDGRYAIVAQPQGQGLLVASGGMQYSLARQGGAASTGAAGRTGPVSGGGRTGQVGAGAAGRTQSGRELAPGFTEDHPQVAEWVQFLAGNKLTTMESYSSGSAGGYSARTDVYLCSDRSFAMRDESSVSVDVGGAFGNSGGVGGGQGQWYVITNGQVVGLVLQFASGETQEFRLDYDYDSQATYANGTRVYVTPAEVCM